MSSLSSQERTRNKLAWASGVCASFVAIEAVGGWLSGSLAVLSDAAHLCTDLLAFLIAMMASHLASLPPSKRYTFGLARLESLAALVSVCLLIFVTLWLLYESVERFFLLFEMHTNGQEHHEHGSHEVNGTIMSATAALGVLVNVVLAVILKENHVHLPGHVHGPNCDHSITIGPSRPQKQDVSINFNSSSTDNTATTTKDTVDIEMGSIEKPAGGFCMPCISIPSTPPSKEDTSSNSPPCGACAPCTSTCAPCAPPVSPTTTTDTTSSTTSTISSVDSDLDEENRPMLGENSMMDDNDNKKKASWSLFKMPSFENQPYQPVQNMDDDDIEQAPLMPDISSAKTADAATTPTNNVNLHAAYLHALTDLAQSVIVLITGVVIWWKPHWHLLDPTLTFVFSLLVLWNAAPVVKRSLEVLLESAPPDMDYDQVHDSILESAMLTATGIKSAKVCGLRIWSVSDGRVGLTCHVLLEGQQQKKDTTSNASVNLILKTILRMLQSEFGIDGSYATIQILYTTSTRSSKRGIICPSCGPEKKQSR